MEVGCWMRRGLLVPGLGAAQFAHAFGGRHCFAVFGVPRIHRGGIAFGGNRSRESVWRRSGLAATRRRFTD